MTSPLYSWLPDKKPPPLLVQMLLGKDERDKDRLGLSMWEERVWDSGPFESQPPFGAPEVTLGVLGSNQPNTTIAAIRVGLHARQINLSSLTLLLRDQKIGPFTGPNADALLSGYLFDLRQDQPSPPIVLAAGGIAFNSGGDPLKKLDNLKHSGNIKSVDATIDAATGPDAIARGNALLDRQAAEIRAGRDRLTGGHFWNEVVTVAGLHHVVGITVRLRGTDEQKEALAVLDGTLNFFAHRQRNMNLPLLAYDISGTVPQHYTLADSPEQALALAQAAWKFLDEQKMSGLYDDLKNTALQIKAAIEGLTGASLTTPWQARMVQSPRTGASPSTPN